MHGLHYYYCDMQIIISNAYLLAVAIDRYLSSTQMYILCVNIHTLRKIMANRI